MNRQIKFRAWDRFNESMLSPHDVNGNKKDLSWFFSQFEEAVKGGNDLVLQQYTGLLDKNGKEIYEGDILNVCNGSINGRLWMQKPYSVKYILDKGFDICMFCWDKDGNNIMDSTHWCEVIGNIYENPELLNP